MTTAAYLFVIQWIIYFKLTNATLGYDCVSEKLNLTTVSLLEVANCDMPNSTVKTESLPIQLLQLVEFNEINVIQCKVMIDRTVYKCSRVFDYLMPVENGQQQYLYDISRDACLQLHYTGTFRFADRHIITGLRINDTTTRGLDLAGRAEDCLGEPYSDLFGSWSKVFVQGKLTFTLAQFTAQASLNSDKIQLRSGTSCRLSDTSCIDMEGGHSFWSALPKDFCNYDHYSVLYDGLATKITDTDMGALQTVYSLTTKEITFALANKSTENVCGHTLVRTEHPKLIIYEKIGGSVFTDKYQNHVQNLYIFSYVNSKFIYVEKHVRTQMKQLYLNLLEQRCNLKRETIKNSLALATEAPDEFAFNLMKSPGYMALVAGEVVHIIKCVPIEVKIKHGEECYNQLQVTRNNETWFMTPRTRILLKRGTQVTCNPTLPSYYRINGLWYKIMPRPTETIAPFIVNPHSEAT